MYLRDMLLGLKRLQGSNIQLDMHHYLYQGTDPSIVFNELHYKQFQADMVEQAFQLELFLSSNSSIHLYIQDKSLLLQLNRNLYYKSLDKSMQVQHMNSQRDITYKLQVLIHQSSNLQDSLLGLMNLLDNIYQVHN